MSTQEPKAPTVQIGKPMDEALAQMLHGRFIYSKNALRPYEKQVKLDLAYLAGIQWIDERQVPDVFVDVRDLPAPSWRVRIVENRILSIYQSLLGRFMAQKMLPTVDAVGADPQNVLAARAASRVLRHIYSLEGDDGALGLEHQMGDLFGYLLATGKAYLYTYWDPDALAKTPGGERQVGDVRTLVLSPLEVFPDPGASRFATAHWCFRSVVKSLDEVKLAYPQARKLKADSLKPQIPLPFGTPTGMRSGLWYQLQDIRDSVLLREYFEKPSPKYPEGRYAIYAGDSDAPILLRYDEKLPYGRVPIREMGFIRVPGAPNPMSLVNQLRDPQRYLNELESRRIEHIRMMAAGKWLLPRGAMVDKESFTSEPGEVINYTGPEPPQHVPMAPLPGDVQIEVQELQQAMQQVAQLSNFGVTAAGGGRMTAVQAMIQREIEDLSRAPFFAEMKSVLKRTFTDQLELAKERYIEPRLMQFGSGLVAEVAALEGTDLDGQWEVKVDINTQGPMSRSERIQVGMELLQIGVFGQPGAEDTVSRFLQFTDLGNMIPRPPGQTDTEVADQENQGMKDGQAFMVGMLDNHAAHLDQHIPFLKKMTMNPGMEMDVVNIVQAHIKDHLEQQQKEAAQAASQQAAAAPAHPGSHPHGPTVGLGPGHPAQEAPGATAGGVMPPA